LTNGRRSKRLRAQDRAHPRSGTRKVLEEKRRRFRFLVVFGASATLAVLGIGTAVAFGGSAAQVAEPRPELDVGPLSALGHLLPPPAQGPIGPEAISIPNAPVLTTTRTDAAGSPVDGVSCDTSEQVVYHIHVHLTVFVDGVQRQIPFGIGIADPEVQPTPEGPFVVSGSCFYWLHTHAADGIIHVESPTHSTYTLGQFFDIWGQTLSTTRVGPATGTVVAFYNGRHYLADPRDIPLTPHANVQLDVDSPLIGPVTVPSWGQL
jgi:hypothetical protein